MQKRQMRYIINACSTKYRISIALATLQKCHRTPFSPRLLKSSRNTQNVNETPSSRIGTYSKAKTIDIIRIFDDLRNCFICSNLFLFAHIFLTLFINPCRDFPHEGILFRVLLNDQLYFNSDCLFILSIFYIFILMNHD